MDGQMMDFQLTLPHILKRAELYFGRGEIVTRLPDKSFHRYTYADFVERDGQMVDPADIERRAAFGRS